MLTDDMMKEFLRMVTEKLADGEEPSRYPAGFEVTAKDVLTDFKIFANELYEGTAEKEDDDSLIVAFNNGQRFRVTVNEIKLEVVN